jgi:uncharacterized protein
MDITPAVDAKTNIISGYNQDNIFINKISHSRKLFLSPGCIREHQVGNISDLMIDDLSWIIEDIEQNNAREEAVLLIGYDEGSISKELKNELNTRNIGFDIMSSQSAYRTYNILATEDRRVYAILF